jgi:hypothetical protein
LLSTEGSEITSDFLVESGGSVEGALSKLGFDSIE